MIGRRAELRTLKGVLDDARSGRGGAVFVVGEAGIGKTRLAVEVAELAAADGMRVLRGRSSTIGPMVPFRPLSEALLGVARNHGQDLADEIGPYLPALGVLVPEWQQDTGGGFSLTVIAEAILRLLTHVSERNGCALVLDDLHDADAETLFILEYLTDNLAISRTLLIGTIRDVPSDAARIARSAAQRGSCAMLELAGLDQETVHRMAAACLDAEAAELPGTVAEQLWRTSAGNPFVVEELLREWFDDGRLVRSGGSWHLVRDLPAAVPAALVHNIAVRTEHLGEQGIEMLSAAATAGQRFPLSVVQRATAMDDRRLLSYVRAGVAAQLIVHDETEPGWYCFRHPLTAEALLAQLTPTTRGRLAARVADAIAALYPELPGEWCPLVGSLRLAAGDRFDAAALFARAGRRALMGAAADSAVTLLTKADDLLTEHLDLGFRGEVRETLVYALGEIGRFEQAFELATSFSGMATPTQVVALHVRMAWLAYLAGNYEDGIHQVSAARTAHGVAPYDEQRAAMDAVHANLLLEMPGQDNIATAEQLANQALSLAEQHGVPAITCQALQVLGIAARERDLDEAERRFEQAQQVADEHRLSLMRTHVLVRLAGHRVLSDADTSSLELARQEATRTGAITATCALDAIDTLNTVLRGDFPAAARRLPDNLDRTTRLKLSDLVRYTHATRAILAAHRGNRVDMAAAITDLEEYGGETSQEMSLCSGLARPFCSLLEEDVDRARRELDLAAETEQARPSGFHLTGQHGLRVLLDVLAGDLAPDQDLPSSAAGRMRWNRQFVHWATAVQLGRRGDPAAANRAAASALTAAEPYRMARHLGARLVTEAATADGWGDPVGWLRGAEEYFYQASVPAVASACRSLLRNHGEAVNQRRTGHESVPAELRRVGVTVREYDVFCLLAKRLGNKEIAKRLHISPKTVEKHVSSLLTKTHSASRVVLSEYATVIAR
ncbi:helix-turn-helix transcriptional regulator [Actinophytocola sp.]|uniref:helix-turn-helix transcriptional regulator n=1 Tax=Actinophytocola sp. TaxID=1872138 RepID=UPI002ED0CBDC